MCNNEKIEHLEQLHGEKAFVYNNEIIKLDYKEISFPIPYNNIYVIKKIEDQNKILIDIFEHKEGKKNDVLPIYHCKKRLKTQ